jgi:hypothetical protein
MEIKLDFDRSAFNQQRDEYDPPRHPHHKQAKTGLRSQQLHVISVISNPIRFQNRTKLFKEYVERTLDAGVTLWVVEASFGERAYETTVENHVHHVRLRCDHELWIKEAMINAAVRFLPQDAKYLMWQDADVAHVRDDWAVETLHALQHYPVVQPFSHALDLGPNYEPMGAPHQGFAYCYREKDLKPEGDYYYTMHPGYAWAWRRKNWNEVGGMIDHAILGAGDKHMADCLVRNGLIGVNKDVHQNYKDMVVQWQERAWESIQGNIGYVPGTIHHYFHGLKSARGYSSRWKILVRNSFDPYTDITRDGNGLWQLRGNKPQLRDDIQKYFRSRSEDYHP